MRYVLFSVLLGALVTGCSSSPKLAQNPSHERVPNATPFGGLNLAGTWSCQVSDQVTKEEMERSAQDRAEGEIDIISFMKIADKVQFRLLQNTSDNAHKVAEIKNAVRGLGHQRVSMVVEAHTGHTRFEVVVGEMDPYQSGPKYNLMFFRKNSFTLTFALANSSEASLATNSLILSDFHGRVMGTCSIR